MIPVVTRFAEHPEWREADQQSERVKKRDEVFLHWADPDQLHQMTLTVILIGFEKMHAGPGRSGSRLRAAAAEWFESSGYKDLMEEAWLRSPVLTKENIRRFRNAASHDNALNLGEAALGCLYVSEVVRRLKFPRLGTEFRPAI